MSFSIDDVRDTIGPDVEGFLGRVEACARALYSSNTLAPPPEVISFTPIEECGHAVHGTSSLVSARSLAQSAELLEQLAGQGHRALGAMALEAARARLIAELCIEGASAMRSMLELELDHQPEAALALATGWAEHAARSQAEPPDAPEAGGGEPAGKEREATPEPDAFSFADQGDNEASELSSTLQRELSSTLQSELSSTFQEEADVLHDLAGVPAPVPVSARVPNPFAPGAPALAPQPVPREARGQTGLVLDLDGDWDEGAGAGVQSGDAGVESAPVSVENAPISFEVEGPRSRQTLPYLGSEPPPAETDPELLDAFAEEMDTARIEVREHAAALLSSPKDTSQIVSLVRIYHTLRGAAASLGLQRVSHRAAELQRLAEQLGEGSAPITRSLLLDLERRSAELFGSVPTSEISADRTPSKRAPETAEPEGARSGPTLEEFAFTDEEPALLEVESAAPPPAGASPGDELIDVFLQEAAEARLTLQGLLQALLSDPGSAAVASRIEVVLHTLKGAAASVGLAGISATAELLRRRIDDAVSAGGALDRGSVEALALDANQLFRTLDLPGIDASAPRAPEDLSGVGAFFTEETRQILKDVADRIADLGAASPERAGEILAGLGQLFHRLKGSALIMGEDAIAHQAARLQDLCGRDASAEAIARAVAELEERIGQRLPPQAHGSSAAPAARSSTSEAAIAGARPGSDARARRLEPTREGVSLPTDPEVIEAFRHEIQELLDDLEKAVLALEESVQPKRALEAQLNIIHTLKGVVFTIGLGPTGKELHAVEDFLEGLQRAAILPPMRDVATFLLEVRADVRRNLKEAASGYVETSLGRVEARIARLLAGSQPTPRRDASSPSSSLLLEGDSQGKSARTSDADLMDPSERRFVRVAVERLDELMNLAGELVVSRSRLMSRLGALRALQLDLNRSRRRLLEAVDGFREQYEFAKLDGQGREAARAAPRRPAPAPLPVGPRELAAGSGPQDDVGTAAPWSTFGELELDRYEDVHILARRLAEIGSDIGEVDGQLLREFAHFSDDSEGFAAIVSGLQNGVTRARMVPLDAVFSRLRLPVRDAAEREGKEVRVVTRGEDVAVDKTIADALFQPLLHLVRNAVVHGVEGAELRAGRGKPRVGSLTLSARQEAGQIVLEISDDGAGLDLEALHARGVAMGLIAPSVPLTDPSVKDLVFTPGLSTRGSAGDVSGRGVGCDVVRRTIERLNGDIRVDAVPAHGTTFLISLPLTLAITKALIVRHERRTYAIPLYFAERILSAEDAKVVASGAERRIRVDSTYLALRNMSDLLALGARTQGGGAVVVLRVGDKRIALQVDAVTGQEEVVVKSLGGVLSGHPLFAGVTIRGTGELTLIMDVPGILEHRSQEAPAAKPTQPVALPSEAVGAPPARPAPAPRKAPGPHRAAPEPLRVLFVDDSVSVRKVAEAALTAAGARVTLAADGIDALEKLRAAPFDVVFTDLEMPRMHGYDLLRELRFLPQYADLPVIVVSSRSQEKHQARARELGANDYITKPFSAQALHDALARWGKRQPPKATAEPPRPFPGKRDRT